MAHANRAQAIHLSDWWAIPAVPHRRFSEGGWGSGYHDPFSDEFSFPGDAF